MLSLKEFKNVKLESASLIFGGRPEDDPNVTGSCYKVVNSHNLGGGVTCYDLEVWNSDYMGVNGLEPCGESTLVFGVC